MSRWSLIVVGCWSLAAQAGVALKFAHEDLKASTFTTMKISGAKVRIEAGPDHLLVWDGATLLVADLRGKSFSRLEPATLKVQGQGLNVVIKALDKDMVKLPPEKRARLKAMVQEARQQPVAPPNVPWTFKATTEKRKVGAYECTMYVATRGPVRHDMCLVPWDKSPVPRTELAALKPLADLSRDLAQRAGPTVARDEVDYGMDTFPGFPALDVSSANPRQYRGTRLLEAATVSLDEATFTLPPGLSEKVVVPAGPTVAP